MEQIDTALIEKIIRFEEITGKLPLAVYLGYEEMPHVKTSVYFNRNNEGTPSFYGINIYGVTVQNHIGVS